MIKRALSSGAEKSPLEYDNLFSFLCWGIGGGVPAGLSALLFYFLSLQVDDQSIRNDFSLFLIVSFVYTLLTFGAIFGMMFTKDNRRTKQFVLFVAAIVTLIYLYFGVGLSGGIFFSPLSFSFVYLPAVVTWYIMGDVISRRQRILQASVFCVLCAGIYLALLGFDGANDAAQWLMKKGAHEIWYKALKAFVLLVEIGATLVFAVTDDRRRSLERA